VKIRFLIANAYGVGGTIKATYNLAGELAKRHDVEIVSVQTRRDVPAFAVPPGVRLRALVDGSPQAQRAKEESSGLVARGKLKLGTWAMTQPSRVIHRRDFRYKNFNLLTDLLLLRFLREVDDGVLIGTRAGLNLAIARFGRRSAIRVGQEHLNATKYGKGIRGAFRRFYPRLDAYSALTERDAAAFSHMLGPGVRVTWAQVARRHVDWELKIFGGGKLQGELEQQIDELGLRGSARLMGYTDQLPQAMAEASFYVMSSRFEGFPMVLLEAMRCGLPIVSYDCPNGPRDLITHGRDGFLVPNGDVDGLAAAMIEMIELGDARRSFGEAALQKSKQYEMPAIARRWEELLEELVAERRQQGLPGWSIRGRQVRPEHRP
jgi:glycosyltransferase involved in cell wall biosynthesis